MPAKGRTTKMMEIQFEQFKQNHPVYLDDQLSTFRRYGILGQTGLLLLFFLINFMENLPPSKDFIRIHQSHIINVNHVLEIDGNTVVLSAEHRLTVSKRMKEQFLKVIGEKVVI